MTEKCIRPLLHFNINTREVINIEAESTQQRNDYKTLHCLIYGRQQQGSKVRVLPFTLCFNNTTICRYTTLVFTHTQTLEESTEPNVTSLNGLSSQIFTFLFISILPTMASKLLDLRVELSWFVIQILGLDRCVTFSFTHWNRWNDGNEVCHFCKNQSLGHSGRK